MKAIVGFGLDLCDYLQPNYDRKNEIENNKNPFVYVFFPRFLKKLQGKSKRVAHDTPTGYNMQPETISGVDDQS